MPHRLSNPTVGRTSANCSGVPLKRNASRIGPSPTIPSAAKLAREPDRPRGPPITPKRRRKYHHPHYFLDPINRKE